MKHFFILILMSLIALCACGKGIVSATRDSYEPKIVIEGYLIAGQKVNKIRISRNFPVDANLRTYNIIPDVDQTQVTITDVEADQTYDLTFHVAEDNQFENYYWQYNGDDLIIQCGKSYRLDVSAPINGNRLEASAVTHVPQAGFEIISVDHDALRYRQRDPQDEMMKFNVMIERSPGTPLYRIVAKALEPSLETFIFDNPYEEVFSGLVERNDGSYLYSSRWRTQNMSPAPGRASIDIYWNMIWYYSDYMITLYAADKNYEEFLLTYDGVQEDDGNFHEPKFNIEGDGIGVFASMIADSLVVKVIE